MAEFVYNSIKNTDTSHIPFKFNYGYYLNILFKDKTNLHLRSRFANKLAKELNKLMEIYC